MMGGVDMATGEGMDMGTERAVITGQREFIRITQGATQGAMNIGTATAAGDPIERYCQPPGKLPLGTDN